MARGMSESEFYLFVQRVIYENITKIRMTLPYKTGNLAYKAFKVTRIGRYKFRIWLDLEIAPYGVFLDYGKPIGNSDKHKGFWNKAMKQLVTNIAHDLGDFGSSIEFPDNT